MNAENIGKAIRFLRNRAGYTQQELAEKLNISDKAISRWERGVGIPDISLLRKLSTILDMDIDSLLEGSVALHEESWKGLLFLENDPMTVIYDKPLFSYLISYYLLAKICDILVLCPEEYREELEKRFGSGEQYGLRLSYCCVDREKRLSDTLSEIKDRFGAGSVLVLYESSIIFGVNLTRFLQKALLNTGKTTVLAIPTGESSEALRMDSEKRLATRGEDEVITEYPYRTLPMLFCQGGMEQLLKYSFSDFPECIRKLSEERQLFVEPMDRGFLEIKTNSPDSVLDASVFVRLYQHRSGLNLYDPEEIARRRGIVLPEET